ncbi:MAG: ATP-binding protein [Solirubrobacterales bacterium]|nr:ATP-binding protein [Solirubrobacterales bacterium]
MSEFPLRYARRNLLIGRGGECSALYRATPASYPFLPVGEKWTHLGRLELFANLVGADFSLWRVQRSYPAERYAGALAGEADADHADAAGWRGFLAGQEARLRDLDSHLPEVYVSVSLGGQSRGAFRSLDRARRRLEDLAGVGAAAPISGSELADLAAAEERVFGRLAGTIGLRRAQTPELQWLLRRGATRGVAEPALEGAWEPDALVLAGADGALSYEPLESDLWRLANEPMVEDPAEPPSLEVQAEAGPNFQAMLCAGALAEEAEFPGAAELLFDPLEGVGFPVDAVLHARWIGNRDALGQIRKRILDVEHAHREAVGSHGGPGWRSEDDREAAREYEAVLQSSAHPPMLRASLGISLGAASRVELERRVATIRERFGDVVLHRPRGFQHRLFFDHLPRTDGGAVGDYRQQMTIEQFAAMVPTATAEVGSATGTYIGYTPAGTRRPVRFDPTEASRTARPTGVLLAGTLGSGKTLASEAIVFAAERRGSLIVDFDPKPDHRLEAIPELAGRVEVLDLSGDPAHRGKLDPLAIAPAELREEIASSYLLDLLRDPPPAWENAIDRAVRDAVRAGERSLLRVVERLARSEAEASRDAAEALDVLSDFGLARLGFSAGGEEEIELPSSVLTIRTPGLSLPDPGASRETYTRVERISVATLSLVAALALRLVSTNRHRKKIVLLDEAWFLLASTQGRLLLNRLVRLGRSMNAAVLLATQRLADLGDLSDLIGTYFLFGQTSVAEAERGLAMVGLDPADRGLRGRLTEYRRGLCLMRDLDGRVGEVQFDLVFDSLLEALDTTPKAAAA